jgi:hypothetical protein
LSFERSWLSEQNGFSTELAKISEVGGMKPHYPKKHFFFLHVPTRGFYQFCELIRFAPLPGKLLLSSPLRPDLPKIHPARIFAKTVILPLDPPLRYDNPLFK